MGGQMGGPASNANRQDVEIAANLATTAQQTDTYLSTKHGG